MAFFVSSSKKNKLLKLHQQISDNISKCQKDACRYHLLHSKTNDVSRKTDLEKLIDKNNETLELHRSTINKINNFLKLPHS